MKKADHFLCDFFRVAMPLIVAVNDDTRAIHGVDGGKEFRALTPSRAWFLALIDTLHLAHHPFLPSAEDQFVIGRHSMKARLGSEGGDESMSHSGTWCQGSDFFKTRRPQQVAECAAIRVSHHKDLFGVDVPFLGA